MAKLYYESGASILILDASRLINPFGYLDNFCLEAGNRWVRLGGVGFAHHIGGPRHIHHQPEQEFVLLAKSANPAVLPLGVRMAPRAALLGF